LGQDWSNEDPGAQDLFYTASDLYQDPRSGDLLYDGEDDERAVGAFKFFKKLQIGKDAKKLRKVKGTGDTHLQSVAEKLGIVTKWVKHQLMPGIQLRVQRGMKVAVANTGTPNAPVFVITPGVRVKPGTPKSSGGDYTGALAFLGLLIKGGATAASAAASKKAERQATRLEAGKKIQIGGLDGAGYNISGALGASEDVGCIMCGALLIDSDGRKIRV